MDVIEHPDGDLSLDDLEETGGDAGEFVCPLAGQFQCQGLALALVEKAQSVGMGCALKVAKVCSV